MKQTDLETVVARYSDPGECKTDFASLLGTDASNVGEDVAQYLDRNWDRFSEWFGEMFRNHLPPLEKIDEFRKRYR